MLAQVSFDLVRLDLVNVGYEMIEQIR